MLAFDSISRVKLPVREGPGVMSLLSGLALGVALLPAAPPDTGGSFFGAGPFFAFLAAGCPSKMQIVN
jgi:hypothetical protein